MVGVFTINSSELSMNFLESLKSMFMGKEIEISVRETKSSNDYSYSSALENLNSIRSDAVENGTADMSLDEINAEIDSYRKGE